METSVDERFKIISQKFENNKIDKEFVEKAYLVAKKLHNGQYRKDGNPYISHPVEVAIILCELGFDVDVISAALLHDVVEDCGYTIEEVEQNFNFNVANLVDAVSAIDKNKYIYDDSQLYEDENFVKSSAEEQTFKKLIAMGNKNPLSFCVKFADRIHNLRTIQTFDRSKQLEKVRETERWVLPIAKILGAKYFYTEIKNLCFKIVNLNDDYGFFNQYFHYHKSNKDNFEKLIIKMKEVFSGYSNVEITSYDMFEIEVFDKITKLIKVNDTKKISQGQILKVSNYNIYLLHQNTSNKKVISDFVDVVKNRLSPIVKIIDASISNFTKGVYFQIEDNYKNKYNVNIMSKNDYNIRMLGTLDGQIDNFIDEDNTHSIPTEFIKIRTRSGEIKYMAKECTALDFAFKIHRDVGYSFKYAIINKSKTKFPPYTKLNDGDQVEVVCEKDNYGNKKNVAAVKWIAYVSTELAKKTLVKYFEKIIKELTQKNDL